MNAILFLDDWMLDSRTNVVRRFIHPARCPQQLTFADPDPPTISGYMDVVRDPDENLYKLWYTVNGKQEIAGKNFNTFLCYAESKDGFVWKRPNLGFWKDYGFEPGLKNAVGFDSYPTVTYKVSRDPFDPDPNRRYKLVATDVLGPITDNNIRGILYASPDGQRWTRIKNACWYNGRMGSDTDNNIIFNPITHRYQIVCRTSCLDRRVALVESEDLIRWTEPQTILYPDSMDEPLIQFYSLTPFWHHDYFLGLMQRQHISSTEQSGGCKWLGKVDDELVYSVNGVHWNRTNRQPFIERSPLTETPCEQIYTNAVTEAEDGTLRFYSLGYNVEHFAAEPPENIPWRIEPMVHTLRPCGFACLEPIGGYGYLATRFLIPRSPDLRINFLAPNGRVRVQISNSEHKPFPGFSFADSVPLVGNEIAARPTWSSGNSLHQFVNEGVRLEFQLFQAQLYALDWDFRIQYGDPIIERI